MKNNNLFIRTEQEIKNRIKIQNNMAVINTIHVAEILGIDEFHLHVQIEQLIINNALLLIFFIEEEQTNEPSYYLSLRSLTFLNFDLTIKRDLVLRFITLQEYMLQFEAEYKKEKV